MPSLFTELRRRNVFKVGATCTKMGRFLDNVNVGYVRFWPKADIRTPIIDGADEINAPIARCKGSL